jgi:hypothetical protein
MDQGADKIMISSIYNSFETHLPRAISEAINNTIVQEVSSRGRINVFFRADDIGVPSKNYHRMMKLFLKYQTPLCLAVVPVWMTRQRWLSMEEYKKKGNDLFCWHMHGYRHMNHETIGKKQEFGPARPLQDIARDLSRGYARLQNIMGKTLTPIFTPPWNRCSLAAMNELQRMGFNAISRSYGSLPLPPSGFNDFVVHVDLHTGKEKLAKDGWQKLLKEFKQGIGSKTCGIMIHHMRMNDQAFILLEYLLDLIYSNKQIKTITYKELL